jgi:hypothetical protein
MRENVSSDGMVRRSLSASTHHADAYRRRNYGRGAPVTGVQKPAQ